jgi:hypothetical protein
MALINMVRFPLPNQQFPHPVQHQNALLLHVLNRYKAHCWSSDRLTDRLIKLRHHPDDRKGLILLKNSVFWQIGKYADDTAPS